MILKGTIIITVIISSLVTIKIYKYSMNKYKRRNINSQSKFKNEYQQLSLINPQIEILSDSLSEDSSGDEGFISAEENEEK